jgi:hypothetical protein
MGKRGIQVNGFEKHNIGHLSASSINLWANAPDVWVMQYMFGKRTGMGPAAWRGICSEDAVVQTLLGGDQEVAIAAALAKFDKRYMIGDEKTTKERDMITPIVNMAVEELKQYGKPVFPDESNQEKISITAKGDNYTIPVIGFLDLVFPDHGLVIDLKTSTKIPSTMSAEHKLQRCIYAAAKGNMAVKFLYVSGKKSSLLEDGDVAETLAQAKHAINRLNDFLWALDKETARKIVPLNKSSFYWSGSEDLRKEFYGV